MRTNLMVMLLLATVTIIGLAANLQGGPATPVECPCDDTSTVNYDGCASGDDCCFCRTSDSTCLDCDDDESCDGVMYNGKADAVCSKNCS